MTLTQIKPAGLSKPVDLADNEKIRLGTGSDFSIFHNGTNNVLSTDNGQVQIVKGASENIAKFIPDGTVELYYDNSLKLATNPGGVLLHDNIRMGDYHIELNDNAQLMLGNAPDFRIYHDGTDSYIQNTTNTLRINNDGTDLVLSTDNNVHIRTNGTEEAVKAIANGAVELYYDNSKKLETSNSGCTLQGTLTTQNTGYGSGSSNLEIQPYGQRGYINWTGTDNFYFRTGTSYATRWLIDGSGHFKPGSDDTYNLGSTGLRWQNIYSKKFETTSTGATITGLGNTTLTINTGNNSGDNSQLAFGDSSDANVGFINYDHGTNNMQFRVNQAQAMVIDNTGDIGIGSNTINLQGVNRTVVSVNGSDSAALCLNRNDTITGFLFADSGEFRIQAEAGAGNLVKIRNNNGTICHFDDDGIKFNGDTAAANALDDYEEGTYTPSVDAWSGYTSVFGYYVKIGKLVNAWGGVEDPSSTTSGSAVQISLPYTATANNHGLGGAGGVMTENVNLSSGNETVVYVKPNEAKFRIYHTTNSYWSTVNGDDCNSASYIYFHVTYYIS